MLREISVFNLLCQNNGQPNANIVHPVLDKLLLGSKLFSTAQDPARLVSTKTSMPLETSRLKNRPRIEVEAKHLPILIAAFPCDDFGLAINRAA